MNIRPRTNGLSAALLTLVASIPTVSGMVHAQAPAGQVKLLFSDDQDVADVWGKLRFGATPMRRLRDCANPGFALAWCSPREDGAWDVLAQRYQEDETVRDAHQKKRAWTVVRATTRDGEHFENVEPLFGTAPGSAIEPGRWTDHLAIAYNPEAKEFLALKLGYTRNEGFGYRAFFSADGKVWKEHPKNPLYFNGDSMGLLWSPKLKRFVSTEKSFQLLPSAKHLPDHGRTATGLPYRRVLTIRSSPDGRQWEPSDSLIDVWGDKFRPLPDQWLTTPDADDPPDLEFYRGNGFWYHDRAFLVVLNYAASPLKPNQHGPFLSTEWWISHDGLHWKRPYRDVNALGESLAPPAWHNPLIIDGKMVFHFGSYLAGMERDRITYAGAAANAEFSTAAFRMPEADLVLNTAVPAPDRVFAKSQAYVMVAVLDEQGKVIPGFEREHCVIQDCNRIDQPLRWKGDAERSARQLAGRTIRLRFYLRGANVYAVTSTQR